MPEQETTYWIAIYAAGVSTGMLIINLINLIRNTKDRLVKVKPHLTATSETTQGYFMQGTLTLDIVNNSRTPCEMTVIELKAIKTKLKRRLLFWPQRNEESIDLDPAMTNTVELALEKFGSRIQKSYNITSNPAKNLIEKLKNEQLEKIEIQAIITTTLNKKYKSNKVNLSEIIHDFNRLVPFDLATSRAISDAIEKFIGQ